MVHWGWAVLALFAGGILGFLTCSMLVLSKKWDNLEAENQEDQFKNQK